MISQFFIRRPIFASVISAFIVLAGLGGIRALPISAYPNIIPPQVTVTAVYPGATAETIAETVAAPLEEQINGVEGMLYMQSVNAGDGTLTINVTFEVGADPISRRSMSIIAFRRPCRACPKRRAARA